MNPTPEDIRAGLARVREGIAEAAAKSGRDPGEVTLVGITKTHPAESVAATFALGLKDMGENRIQEAADKIPLLPSGITWHMVGSLQTNKARQALGLFGLIQSLDRPRLAEVLNRVAGETGRPCHALIQVNVTGARGQGGVTPGEAGKLFEICLALPYLRIDGLMAIGPYPAGEDEIRAAYRGVVDLFKRLAPRAGPGFGTLSFGMSGDYRIAVEEGSTLVRVGTAIFGGRMVT